MMKTPKVLLLAMLFMAIASPAKACDCQPDSKVTISASDELVCEGDTVTLTITEENTGGADLINVRVDVFEDGALVLQLVAPPDSGDDGDSFLRTDEAWTWQVVVTINSTTTFTAIGWGLCPCGNEITYPDYPNERDEVTVDTEPCNPDFTVEKICPFISKVGDEVCYTIIITNTGNMPLLIASVNDSLVGPILDCVHQVLEPGESCDPNYCMIVPPDAPDPLVNTVTVEAGVIHTATSLLRSSQCETDLVEPDIDLEKTVNDPNACPGDTVTYTICIENTGDWPLENVEVEDPLLSPIYGSPLPGFPPILFPGEIFCVDFPYVVPPDAPCPLVNCAEVTANPLDLPNVIDANDCAEICCEPPGGEGCTPGFWKNNGDKQGASAWCDLFSPSMRISDVFILNEPLVIRGNGKSTITDPTLLQALNANGGGVNAMVRHVVAALLNACSKCVHYPINDPLKIIIMIEDTLNEAPGAYSVEELHSMFAEYNEAGCPVNQHGDCVGVED